MTFFNFLEANYVQNNVQQQQQSSFTSWGNAQLKAVHGLINAQRVFFTWLNYPIMIAKYLFTVLGIIAPPKSASQFIEEFNAKAAAAKENTQASTAAVGSANKVVQFAKDPAAKPVS